MPTKTDLEADFFEEYISSTYDPNVLKSEPRGASISTLLLLSMPRLAIQMAWAAQWAALGPYLGTMLPKYAVQLTQWVGPISGLLIAPTFGVLSDRCTSRMGRRRPFLIGGGLLSCICWMLMGYTRQIGELLGDYGTGEEGVPTSRFYTGLFTIVFYTWMDITVNVAQTPAFLLVADFAGDRQTTGCALGEAWAILGTLIVSAYIEIFGAAHLTLRWFLAMLAIFMFLTVTVACLAAQEEQLQQEEVVGASSIQRIAAAFGSIYQGLVTMPYTLAIYAFIVFFVQYGWISYTGNKGQFFGLEVYGGDSANADACAPHCSDKQNAYNHGVKVAGGMTDFVFNAIGYAYLWVLPHLVSRYGVKTVLTIALLPQCMLVVMAFSKVVLVDVVIVITLTFTQCTIFALIVPIIVHLFGPRAEIGIYVGAVNSANCLGQLLTFVVGTGLVETSMGYKLPVFVGGVTSIICVLVCIFLFHIRIYTV